MLPTRHRATFLDELWPPLVDAADEHAMAWFRIGRHRQKPTSTIAVIRTDTSMKDAFNDFIEANAGV